MIFFSHKCKSIIRRYRQKPEHVDRKSKTKILHFPKNSYNRANTPTHQKAFTKYGHRGPNSPEYMTN